MIEYPYMCLSVVSLSLLAELLLSEFSIYQLLINMPQN
jgi:hypothetical protein